MAQRRKCRLADSSRKDTDLCQYAELITEAIDNVVPDKNPKVFRDYFSTDPLTQSEAVSVGRALAKIPELKELGKTVTTFRLFDGRTYESEASKEPINTKKSRPKGGRMN